jgi:hypothetical protein
MLEPRIYKVVVLYQKRNAPRVADAAGDFQLLPRPRERSLKFRIRSERKSNESFENTGEYQNEDRGPSQSASARRSRAPNAG